MGNVHKTVNATAATRSIIRLGVSDNRSSYNIIIGNNSGQIANLTHSNNTAQGLTTTQIANNLKTTIDDALDTDWTVVTDGANTVIITGPTDGSNFYVVTSDTTVLQTVGGGNKQAAKQSTVDDKGDTVI